MSYFEIGRALDVNPGRVSEIIAGETQCRIRIGSFPKARSLGTAKSAANGMN
jgi:hypothetical protein